MTRIASLPWVICITLVSLVVISSCRKELNTTQKPDSNPFGPVSEEFTWNTTHEVSADIGLVNASLAGLVCRINIFRPDPQQGFVRIYSGSIRHSEVTNLKLTVPTANHLLRLELILPDESREIKDLEGSGPFSYTFSGIGTKSGLSGNDTDHDGVVDPLDDFPNDPDLAFRYAYPLTSMMGDAPLNAPSWATYCFEDLWPAMGDFDMNDLVINYSYVIYTDANHFVKKIEASFMVKASGAWTGWKHGFGISLVGLPADQVEGVIGYQLSPGTYISLGAVGLEKDQSGNLLNPAVIIPFDNFDPIIHNPEQNFFNTLPGIPCGTADQLDMTITLIGATTVADADIIPGNFNPFLIRNLDRTYEIHKVDCSPTSWASLSNFGLSDDASKPNENLWYRTKDNLPWALDLPIDFDYPSEYVNIQDAYPQFQTWALSSGTVNQSWYLNPSPELGKVFSCSSNPPGTFTCGENLIDTRDGKSYTTVQIGTQCWMKENLNIGTRVDGSLEQTDNGMIEKYCQDDLEANCEVYGGLYRWDEMMQYVTNQGAEGICPYGWHVPTDAEWETLSSALSGFWVAGGKMKEMGTTHWESPNTGATNSSGFTALPGGSCSPYGDFNYLSTDSYFWSSSEYTPEGSPTPSNGYGRYLWYNWTRFSQIRPVKSNGFSIRCLKDELGTNQPPTASNVGQSGNAQVGQSLTGFYTYNDAEGNPESVSTFQWYRDDHPNGITASAIPGATGLTYTLQENDLDKYISFAVIPVALTGSSPGIEVTSFEFAGPIEAAASFTCGDPFLDTRDGQSYNTVQIGTQCWMKENLNTGTIIDLGSYQSNNGIIEKYCFDNDPNNCNIYGGLYQWDEMMEYSETEGGQGICPTGWHVPSKNEWSSLIEFLGGSAVAGDKMKETGILHWSEPNIASNSSGFTALGGGYLAYHCCYSNFNELAYFWTSTHGTAYWEWWFLYMWNGGTNIINNYGYNQHEFGFSVRCMKN